MGTIKFRAKVKLPEDKLILRKHEVPEGQWVYGEPHTIDCPTPHIHTVDVGKQPIDEETICQFTGLYDRNKKEIYEGDIIADAANTIYVCTFEHGCFDFRDKDGRGIANPIACVSSVVGNIHDNPDMMEGGER